MTIEEEFRDFKRIKPTCVKSSVKTREEIVNSMSLQDAIQVFKDTNAYGTMDIAKSVILKELEQQSKTAHWIPTEDYITTCNLKSNLSMYYLKCSCCGGDCLEVGKYCPKCGARMINNS